MILVRIFGWFMIVMGSVGALIAVVDVPVPGRRMILYLAEIAIGYTVKRIGGDPWPLPRHPKATFPG